MVSPPEAQAPPRILPATASLEHLKKQAKARLRVLRARTAGARLADAQLAIARDYGFASWRALKASVERTGPAGAYGRLTGYYRLDPGRVSNSVVKISEEHGELFAQGIGRPRTPLAPVGPDIFGVAGSPAQYRFDGPADQPAQRVLVGTEARFVVAVRTDADDAKRAEADYARDLADQARPRTRVAIDPDRLEAYVGLYSATGTTIDVTRRGAGLFAQVAGQPQFEIQCEGPDRFFYATLPIQISFRVPDGNADALMLHQRGRTTTFHRTSPEAVTELVEAIERRRDEQERPRVAIALSAETLARYVGRYDMDQTNSFIVTLEGERLFGVMSGQRRFEMFAEAEARFFLTVAAVQISFIEDASGRIDRAVIHQYGNDLIVMREISEGEGE